MHFSTVDVVTQTRCSWAVCKCVCVCVCLCVGWSLLYVFLQMPLCWYTLSACACNEHFYLFGRGYAELADFFVQEPKSVRKRSKNKNVEKEREVLLLHPNSYPPKATTELKSITHKHTHTHTHVDTHPYADTFIVLDLCWESFLKFSFLRIPPSLHPGVCLNWKLALITAEFC